MSTIDFEWNPVSADRYDEMLGVLPPAVHLADGFLVGEPYSSRGGRATFSAYRIINGAHFVASEPLTILEFRSELGR